SEGRDPTRRGRQPDGSQGRHRWRPGLGSDPPSSRAACGRLAAGEGGRGFVSLGERQHRPRRRRLSPCAHTKGGGKLSEPQVSTAVAVVGPEDVDTLKEPEPAPLLVRSFGLTDAGKVRSRNEDQFLVAVLLKTLQVHGTSLPQPRLQRSSDCSYLFVVADGMG